MRSIITSVLGFVFFSGSAFASSEWSWKTIRTSHPLWEALKVEIQNVSVGGKTLSRQSAPGVVCTTSDDDTNCAIAKNLPRPRLEQLYALLDSRAIDTTHVSIQAKMI